MAKLTEFVMELAQNPGTLQRFQNRPEEYIKEIGLSPAEQAVLLSKDPVVLRDAIARDVNVSARAAQDWVVVLVYVK